MSTSRVVISVYVRHSADCSMKNNPFWKRCKCRKWLYINHNGKRTQTSARTRSWERAEEARRKLEQQLLGSKAPQPAEESSAPRFTGQIPEADRRSSAQRVSCSLKDAVTKFLAAKKAENLADATISKLTTIFQKQLLAWAAGEGIRDVEEIGIAELETFRNSWEDAPLARKKKQERVIGFFYYCLRMGWIQKNPAVLLGRIKVQSKPTDYFPKKEFEQIIDATYVYNPKAWNTEPRNMATRVRTLILLMRWSGLAITDAVGLERSRLNDNDELFLYRAKTGHPVYVPLPSHIAEALRNIPPGPKPNPRYFFWTGAGKPKSAVGNWQRSLRRVFKLADIKHPDGSSKRCHPHMFRDTFAVECLLAGVSLDHVSMLLGHKSVKITERDYAPWVKARQEQLTATVRQSWPNFAEKQQKLRNSRKKSATLTTGSSAAGERDNDKLSILVTRADAEFRPERTL